MEEVPPEVVEEAAGIVCCINDCARFANESTDFRDREANQEVVRLAIQALSRLVERYPAIRITRIREFEFDYEKMCIETAEMKDAYFRRR